MQGLARLRVKQSPRKMTLKQAESNQSSAGQKDKRFRGVSEGSKEQQEYKREK